MRWITGEYPAAAQVLEQALGLSRDLGVRGDEAETLNEIGTLHRISGDLAQAEGCHQRALDLARAIAGSWIEAPALAGLGRCALADGVAGELAGLAEAGPRITPVPAAVPGGPFLRMVLHGQHTASAAWLEASHRAAPTLKEALVSCRLALTCGGDDHE